MRTFHQALQDRQREAGGLAGAGLCDAEQVLACEDMRDGLFLDRGWRFIALMGKRLQKALFEAKGRKLSHYLDFHMCESARAQRALRARLSNAKFAGCVGRPACYLGNSG